MRPSPSIITATAIALILAPALVFAEGRGLEAAQAPASPNALPRTIRARVHPVGNPKAEPLFTYVRESKSLPSGGRLDTGSYRDPAGAVAAEERAEFSPSGNLLWYELDQRQIGTKGRLEVKDGKARFSFEKDGKSKTAEEAATTDLIVGPTLASHLSKNWAALQKGESVRARLAVLDRRETVGFKFTKVGEGESQGRKGLKIKMSASSMIIAALVDPLIFTLSPDGARVLQFEGRTIPKRKSGDSWKDLEALTIYED